MGGGNRRRTRDVVEHAHRSVGVAGGWSFLDELVRWVTAASNALLTVILATVAFTVLGYSGGLFGRKSGYARNVDAGYWIICLVIMILCQGIF
jgi:hypothetical protein